MSNELKVILVEDEAMALSRLERLLDSLEREVEVVAKARSVQEATDLIPKNPEIDLGFFDIQLLDGLSFDIFDRIQVDFPVVFTTAFEQYAIQAFKHHSVGYLLKPVGKEELQTTLDKYNEFWKPSDSIDILSTLQELKPKFFKERFTLKVGSHIKMVKTEDICLFYSMQKGTYLLTNEGRSYDLDLMLDGVADLLDPAQYFRVNRKHLVRIDAIDSIVQFTNSRLKLTVSAPFDEEIIVAREKVKAFKTWLEGV